MSDTNDQENVLFRMLAVLRGFVEMHDVLDGLEEGQQHRTVEPGDTLVAPTVVSVLRHSAILRLLNCSATFRYLYLGTVVLLVLSVVSNSLAYACSQHGTGADNVSWLATGSRGGVETGLLTLETSLVAPTTPTNCTAGVGLGSLDNLAPAGLEVTAMSIVVVDGTTGGTVPLGAFSFSPNSITTSDLNAGSGASSPPNTNPLFEGSSWFGFSSPVDPFTVPPLGPDEFTAFQFTVEVPTASLPVRLDAQFAGGEGQADGTPIFEGDHPVQYFTAADSSILFTAQVPEPTTWTLLSICMMSCLKRRRIPVRSVQR